MKRASILAACLALAVAHCGSNGSNGKGGGPPGEGAPDTGVEPIGGPADAGVETPGFVADPLGSGPRLWIQAALGDSGRATVELWASELGPVFGYSAHVRFDASHLELAAGSAQPEAPVVLGSDDPAKAIELWTKGVGDIGIGAVRKRPELGEISVAEATKLGTLTLEVKRPGRSQISIERAVVRRADGRFVKVSVFGGTMVTREGGAS